MENNLTVSSKAKMHILGGTISCITQIIPPYFLLTNCSGDNAPNSKQWVYLLIHSYLLTIYSILGTVQGFGDSTVKEADQTPLFMIILCQLIEIPEQNRKGTIFMYSSNNRWPSNFYQNGDTLMRVNGVLLIKYTETIDANWDCHSKLKNVVVPIILR